MSATHHFVSLRHKSSSMATMSRKVNSDSAMIRCSSSIRYPSRSTGRDATVAQSLATPLRRSST